MSYTRLDLTGEGPIAELILDRPEVRNAMDYVMGQEVQSCVRELNARDDLRAVLVRGRGKVFSAGGDFAMLETRAAEPPEANRRAMLEFYGLFLSIRELRVPSVAVIQGAAMGAGLCFALGCDLRIAASDARLGLNFVKVGLHPGMAATYLLPRLIGPARAAELLLTGRTIEAGEAHRIGLVNEVEAPNDLLARARAIGEEIASAAPLAVAQTKASLRGTFEKNLEQAMREEAYAQSIDYGTEDLGEAVRAFRAKRKPLFIGR